MMLKNQQNFRYLSLIGFLLFFLSTEAVSIGNFSTTIEMDCIASSSQPICCSAVTEPLSSLETTSKIFNPYPNHPNSKKKHILCDIEKKYYSSPFELHNIEKAFKINAISDINLRFDILLLHISLEQYHKNSTIWLSRVKFHMKNGLNHLSLKENLHDKEYLSYFEYKKSCTQIGKSKSYNTTWKEWIEPITLTLSNPLSINICPKQLKPKKFNSDTEIGNIDHLLLQSGRNIYNVSHALNGLIEDSHIFIKPNLKDIQTINNFNISYDISSQTRKIEVWNYWKSFLKTFYSNKNLRNSRKFSSVAVNNLNQTQLTTNRIDTRNINKKFYLFDASSNSFDNSLKTLTCGYSQVFI